MFDQTDVAKIRYLLSQGIDYDRAKKLVTQHKAANVSSEIATNAAQNIPKAPASVPAAVPTQPSKAITYPVNPSPSQAPSSAPITSPNAQQMVDSSFAQFDTTKVGKTIKGAVDAVGNSLESGAKGLIKGAKGLIEKPLQAAKIGLYPLGGSQLISQAEKYLPKPNSDTNIQQDVLNIAQGATDFAFSPAVGAMGAVDVHKSPFSTSNQDISDINQKVGNFVSKVPGISGFREQLPAEDQQRFDSLLGVWSTIALTEGIKGFNKFRAEQYKKSITPDGPATSYVDANGNVRDYGPPPGSKALNAPEPIVKPPSYGPREPEVNKLLTKAVAQNVGGLKTAGNVEKSLNNLKGGITTIVQLKNKIQSLPKDDAGNIDYKFIEEAEQSAQTVISQSIAEAKQQLRSEVETAIQTAGTEQIRPDPTPLLTMLDEQTKNFIDSQGQVIPGTDAAYREYQNIINYLSDGQKTVADLQKLSTQLNRDAKQLYTGNPTPTSVIAEAVNYHLRQLLDDTIENQLGVLGFGELKRKWGELKAIEPAITKRGQVIDRQKPVGLFDFLGNFGAIDGVIDIIAGNPVLGVVKAGGMKLLKMYVKGRNDQSKMLIKAMRILDEANGGREHNFNMNSPQFQAKKAERTRELNKQEAEQARKRAETYLQTQRKQQPKPIGVKTTTVTPEGVSKQSVVVPPAKTIKPNQTTREIGLIGVKKQQKPKYIPKEVFQLKSDVDNSFERMTELDTNQNYEKVGPTEPLGKGNTYETQYGTITAVNYNGKIQQVTINGKQYNRSDVDIYKKLNTEDKAVKAKDSEYSDIRKKLQDIKFGNGKFEKSQLNGVLQDLGIDKISDIPDEALQSVLDMARARVNKPSGILGVKKVDNIEQSRKGGILGVKPSNQVKYNQGQYYGAVRMVLNDKDVLASRFGSLENKQKQASGKMGNSGLSASEKHELIQIPIKLGVDANTVRERANQLKEIAKEHRKPIDSFTEGERSETTYTVNDSYREYANNKTVNSNTVNK